MVITLGAFLLFTAIIVVASYSIVVLLWPNQLAMQHMLMYLKRRLLKNDTAMLPLTPETIAQWSTNRIKTSKSYRFWVITSGCFLTLGGQPVLLFERCVYKLGRKLIVARHGNQFWHFTQSGNRFDIYVDEEFIGHIANNEAIYDQLGQLWGQLRFENRARFVYLRVHDADLATFVTNTRGRDQTAAVLPSRPLLPHEQHLFVAVLVWLYAV